MFAIKRATNRLSPPLVAADARLRMPGVAGVLRGGALVALLAGTGFWIAVKEPEPPLKGTPAAERLEFDRREERAFLVAKLGIDTSDLACSPAPTGHALSCETAEYGILRKTTRFDVPLASALPLVALSFHAGTQRRFTLKFGTQLPRYQRRAILRTISLYVTGPPLSRTP